MTFDREPNTFPNPAAHVLKNEPSIFEREPIMNDIYACDASHINLYVTRIMSQPITDENPNNNVLNLPK